MRSASDLIELLSYAASGSKERPDVAEYDAGTVPGQELPAYWWNYLINVLTGGHDQIKVNIDNIIAELNTILTEAGITPDDELTNQVIAALKLLFYHSNDVLITEDSPLVVNTLNIVQSEPGYAKINLSLPSNPKLSDVIRIKALSPCDILQNDAEHVISWDMSLFTTVGINGYIHIPANTYVELIYNGSNYIITTPTKITDPAALPASTGFGSSWSPDGRYLVIAHNTTPFITIYDWITGSPVKITDPTILPAGNSQYSAWSPDGRYLAIAHATTPFVTIYDWISGSPVKITDPATLPTGSAYGATWSPDGRYLAITHDSSPFVTIYDWISGIPVKIANPATLPAGIGALSSAWSPDGRYLAVPHSSTPYITIYDWISGSPIKITDPATLPPNTARGSAWSPDGRYLAITHDSSPFVTIYDWISGIPVKIANPAALPPDTGRGTSWSPDGRYLVVPHDGSPYITIYDWISGNPVKIANPVTLPPSSGRGSAWSPDGRYLSLAHSSSPYVTIYDNWMSVNKKWAIDIKLKLFRSNITKNILAHNFH